MKTIALRFGEHFAPPEGTIAAHQAVINQIGFVWYGKFGAVASRTLMQELIDSENPVILLINSGKADRYWAHITGFTTTCPACAEMPAYYAYNLEKMKCWFKITKFEPASKDVMSLCTVISSGNTLSEASKHSMSPYFIIEYKES